MELKDGDYTLTDGAAWFSVNGFAIRIHTTDEGVAVDMYKDGKENENAFAGCYGFFSELENDDDDAA